jgi:hypothetical protein
MAQSILYTPLLHDRLNFAALRPIRQKRAAGIDYEVHRNKLEIASTASRLHR